MRWSTRHTYKSFCCYTSSSCSSLSHKIGNCHSLPQNVFVQCFKLISSTLTPYEAEWKLCQIVTDFKFSSAIQMQSWIYEQVFGSNYNWVVRADFCWPVSRAGFCSTVGNLKPRYQLNSNTATKTAAVHLPKGNFLCTLSIERCNFFFINFGSEYIYVGREKFSNFNYNFRFFDKYTLRNLRPKYNFLRIVWFSKKIASGVGGQVWRKLYED